MDLIEAAVAEAYKGRGEGCSVFPDGKPLPEFSQNPHLLEPISSLVLFEKCLL